MNKFYTYLALVVDDDLIVSESQESIDAVLNNFRNCFEITIAEVGPYVGMQIEKNRTKKILFLHQSFYIRQLLKKFNMSNATSVSVPADPHTILSKAEPEQALSNIPCRKAVGSLIFLASVMRPDIAYVVSVVSRFCNQHNQSHWSAIKRILKYLVGTVNYGILYESGGRKLNLELELIGYSDAKFAGDVDTRRSTSGYVFCINGSLVTWSSQRQRLVTLSTTESEYVTAATACKEAMWLRQLLTDLNCRVTKPAVLFVDRVL